MISQRIANLFTGYNWMIIPVAFLTVVLHEIAHGFVAYLLGDRTAKNAGRLTLNPIKHIDIWGLLAMILFGFGWAKPVPVNPYFFKNRKAGMAITAFAGPAANLLLALLGAFALSGIDGISIIADSMYYSNDMSAITLGVAVFLWNFITLNVGLAIFNLIPIPPLDGSKILNAILPQRVYFKVMQYERYGFLVLILLLNIPFFNNLINGTRNLVCDILYLIVGL